MTMGRPEKAAEDILQRTGSGKRLGYSLEKLPEAGIHHKTMVKERVCFLLNAMFGQFVWVDGARRSSQDIASSSKVGNYKSLV